MDIPYTHQSIYLPRPMRPDPTQMLNSPSACVKEPAVVIHKPDDPAQLLLKSCENPVDDTQVPALTREMRK